MRINELEQVNEFEWLIRTSFREDMRVPVRVFATRAILEEVLGDASLEQAVNAATLPGLAGEVVVMPDMHQGYGFPIGGVAATRVSDGVISPGAIGYDINCGVRLLSTDIELAESRPWLEDLAISLDQNCPRGVGVGGHLRLSRSELEEVCVEGSHWAKKKGYATDQDLIRTEDDGRLGGADPALVSKRALERGQNQLGTLGSGNHFIEVDVVEEIHDHKAASVMGLEEGMLAVQIHCGSRGFGHQICSDYVREFQGVVNRYGIILPDRSLVCAPLNSAEGKAYLSAMRCAANYAFCNRQVLAHYARIAFETVFAGKVPDWNLRPVYDLAHNIGKVETHQIGGEPTEVCVHRKGATRAFGPGIEGVPAVYEGIGQPVLVPGSMGTSSWVLVGTAASMEKTFGSCCHGAGRVMSRKQAKKSFHAHSLVESLKSKGIIVQAGSMPGLTEEAPKAYKDVDQVVDTVVGAGIAHKVARLRPLVVIKG